MKIDGTKFDRTDHLVTICTPKLKYLVISYSDFPTLDCFSAPNLKYLSIFKSNIPTINFECFPKIEILDLFKCQTENLLNLQLLPLKNIHIQTFNNFPVDNVPSTIKRGTFYRCGLREFPYERFPRLKFLDLSWNEIESLDGIENCQMLTHLNIKCCLIRELRPLRALQHLRYVASDMDLMENQDPATARYLQRLMLRGEMGIYNDVQNVHDSTVQNSVTESVNNLLKDPVVSLDLESIIDSELSEKTKEAIIEYCAIPDVHSVHDLTFGELFAYIWARIQDHDSREEMYKILEEQIADAECMCFTGRFSRVISVLIGFYDDIQIHISNSSRISSIIINIGKRIDPYDANKHREEAIRILKDIGYDQDTIESWVSAIE